MTKIEKKSGFFEAISEFGFDTSYAILERFSHCGENLILAKIRKSHVYVVVKYEEVRDKGFNDVMAEKMEYRMDFRIHLSPLSEITISDKGGTVILGNLYNVDKSYEHNDADSYEFALHTFRWLVANDIFILSDKHSCIGPKVIWDKLLEVCSPRIDVIDFPKREMLYRNVKSLDVDLIHQTSGVRFILRGFDK